MIGENFCYYSISISGYRNSFCDYNPGAWSNILFRTKNLKLAQQVFVFYLIGKGPNQKMTAFEYQKAQVCLQKRNYKSFQACNCNSCERILCLNQQKLQMQTSFDFNTKVYHQLDCQYYIWKNNNKVSGEQQKFTLQDQSTQQITDQMANISMQ